MKSLKNVKLAIKPNKIPDKDPFPLIDPIPKMIDMTGNKVSVIKIIGPDKNGKIDEKIKSARSIKIN